jgi:hypothetical protein
MAWNVARREPLAELQLLQLRAVTLLSNAHLREVHLSLWKNTAGSEDVVSLMGW